MRTARLEDMVKGWFVGNFDPTMCRTNDVEVAVKHYQSNEREHWHYHRVATELTVIVSGEVEMNGEHFSTGDIIVLDPGEGTDFKVLADTVSVVVKIPGASNDKYLKGE